jgi:L-threonylcarbamoyladenylate synthase
MSERHYQPRTPLYMGLEPSGRCAYLWHTTEKPAFRAIRMPTDAAAYAACLYDILHRLDQESLEFITVESVSALPDWDGIRDRLNRAAQK